MEIKINEADSWFGVTIIPGNVEEASLLARMTLMSKKEPLNLYTSFGKKGIEASFYTNKKQNSRTSLTVGRNG